MKKSLILAAIFTSSFFVSCDEKGLLEPFTPGSLTEDVAIKTSTDLQNLLNTSYALLFTREEAVFTSVFTDEAAIGFANGGQGITQEYVFFLNPSSTGPNAIWNSCYFSLARANRVIAYADKITPLDAADADKINRMKAEALILRAYAHLKILSYFSTDMKDDNALAGILADRVIPTSESGLSRATNGAFYTSIHADIDSALTIYNSFTSDPFASTNKTFFANPIFGKALKARAYAYKGDYTNAEVWADQVIASGISLATTAQYKSLFWSESEPANTEVIFRLKRTGPQNGQGSNMHNGWCSIRPAVAGSPFYEVGRGLFNRLNPSNVAGSQFASQSDVRLHTICAPSSVVDPAYLTSTAYKDSDKLILHKYGGVATGSTTWATTATNGNNNDFKVCRISEMYLIKAEARAAAGDLTGAAAAVHAVNAARNTVAPAVPVYSNVTAAWAGILDQRRVEFAFEGFRFLDLKRLAGLAGVTALDRHPMDYDSVGGFNFPGANPSNLPMNSYKFAMPIPISELNANPGIVQNPQY
ncbi:MAG: hypothetical protein RLZZ500_1989 [Bacteroidota bacterium]|jgi:hypothetical protein